MFEVGYYDQNKKKLSSSLLTMHMLLVSYICYKSCTLDGSDSYFKRKGGVKPYVVGLECNYLKKIVRLLNKRRLE